MRYNSKSLMAILLLCLAISTKVSANQPEFGSFSEFVSGHRAKAPPIKKPAPVVISTRPNPIVIRDRPNEADPKTKPNPVVVVPDRTPPPVIKEEPILINTEDRPTPPLVIPTGPVPPTSQNQPSSSGTQNRPTPIVIRNRPDVQIRDGRFVQKCSGDLINGTCYAKCQPPLITSGTQCIKVDTYRPTASPLLAKAARSRKEQDYEPTQAAVWYPKCKSGYARDVNNVCSKEIKRFARDVLF